MNISLNFSKEEKGEVLRYLQKFPSLAVKTKYEEYRCKIQDCVVTLYSSGKLLIQGKDAAKTRGELLHNLGLEGELLLGIDEAGRGESRGSFAVAGVLGNTNELRGLRDSKKMRDLKGAKEEVLRHSRGHFVALKSAAEIDTLRKSGRTMNDIELELIAAIVQNFREKGFKGRILVDGKPLKQWLRGIEFMPRADDLNPVVAAASILAKTARNESKDNALRKSWKKG